MLTRFLSIFSLVLVFGLGGPVPADNTTRILVLGDSMLASNRLSGNSVAKVLQAALKEKVVDRSVPGARYFHFLPISGAAGMNIALQYRPGPWTTVVMNGGGNDLLFGCGCGKCTNVLNRLISPDGKSGAIPSFVKTLRNTGAQVYYIGYLRNPGVNTPIKSCGPAGNELDRRLAKLDALDKGMTFLPMSDLVPKGDTSFHGPDLIHPSVKGSRAIGLRIVRAMK